MIANRNAHSLWWDKRTPLNAGVTVAVNIGCDANIFAPAGNLAAAPTHDLPYLTFILKASQNLTLTIDGSNDASTWVNWLTYAYLTAGGAVTPYSLPDPFLNNVGYLVNPCFWTRIRLQNPGGVQATVTFMARAFKQ